MDPRLRNAIAKIEVRQGGQVTSRGTGTLVAEDLVLTALHVVGDRRSDPVQFYPGEVLLTFPGHTTLAVPVDGKCHSGLDWALLRCAERPPARPVPLGDLDASGGDWTTYGFPDAQPVDGMVQAGTVRNADARLNGQPTFQLFSEEAAAGQGAPVKGLSGGPMLVDGALVGVLRFALMKEGQAVAGTLYACPARVAVEACEGLLPIPDPCHGLPGLPRRPLPAEPYRYLSRYREEDAEIFFGRNRSIREVYEQVTDDDGAGVVLFYGQTGVGKSSFLDAGLVPRLRWTHQVRYLRREASRTLLATLRHGLASELGDDGGGGTLPLDALWRRVEEETERPIVVILDQVEEAYTRRNPARKDEVAELGRAVRDVFHGDGPAPRGQLVLGFRKEWYPEVQKRLDECGVEFSRVFLETLDDEGVAEAVVGLTRTRRLRERYGLTVAPELPQVLARQLGEDPDSPIAPTLQILLAKMWQTACAANAHAPQFTLDLYTRLKHEGALLGDFLDQQIAALSRRRPADEASGLVLDILARHTTPLLTADECDGEQLRADYGHHEDLAGLLGAMQELYLLVDAGGDAGGGGTRSRLAHDTLAPIVRKRFDDSAYPGQAASRILLSRVPADADPDELVPLDGHDLRTVEAGLRGMRALRPAEQALVDASRVESRRRRRVRATVQVAFLVLLVVLAGATVIAVTELRTAERQTELTKLSNTTDEVRGDLVSEPIDGLQLSFWAVCSSLAQGYAVAPELKMSLSNAVEQARERQRFTLPREVNALALHPDEKRFAVALENGDVTVLTRAGAPFAPTRHCHAPGVAPPDELVDGHHPFAARKVAYSPDGAWLYAAGNDGRLRAWRPDVANADELSAEHGGAIRALAVAPADGRVATGGEDGAIRIWTPDLSRCEATLRAADQGGGVNALTFTDAGELVAGSDDGFLRVWDPDAAAAPLHAIHRHQGPVLAVAVSRVAGADPLIASGSADETVRVFRDDLTPLQTLNWRRGEETEHEHAGVSDRRDVVIADHEAAVRAVAFAPGGVNIMSADEDGVVLLNDVRGEPAARPFLGPNAAVRAIVYERVLPVALIGSLDHTVRERCPHGLKIGVDLRPREGAIRHDDTQMLCVAYSGDGSLLAGGGADGSVTVWDEASGQALRRLAVEGGRVVALRFVGTELLAACDDGRLRVWPDDPQVQEPRVVIDVDVAADGPGARLTALGSDAAGRVVVVGCAEGAVHVVDLARGEVTQSLPPAAADGPAPAGVTAIAVSPNGRELAVARDNSDLEHEDARVELWRHDGVWTQRGVRQPSAEEEPVVRGLAFAPTGRVLLGVSADGMLRAWSLDAPADGPVVARKAHIGAGNTVAASADGTRVVTGGADGGVVLWWLQDEPGARLRLDRIAEMVPAHHGPVVSVAFGGHDEQHAASASRDGSIRTWSARYDLWLEIAADRLRQHPATDQKDGDDERDVGAFLDAPPWR